MRFKISNHYENKNNDTMIKIKRDEICSFIDVATRSFNFY